MRMETFGETRKPRSGSIISRAIHLTLMRLEALAQKNYYVPYGGETSPAAPDVPTTGGAEAALAWCLILLAAGLWAAARKRRIRKT